MPARHADQERGGEIRSRTPFVAAAAGGLVAAFVAGGGVLVITIAFGASLGALLGLLAVAARRRATGRELGPSGELGRARTVPTHDTQESVQHAESTHPSPSSRS